MVLISLKRFTEVSLYLNRKLDTQNTIQEEPIYIQENFFGKASMNNNFKGIVIFPSCWTINNITNTYECSLKTISEYK